MPVEPASGKRETGLLDDERIFVFVETALLEFESPRPEFGREILNVPWPLLDVASHVLNVESNVLEFENISLELRATRKLLISRTIQPRSFRSLAKRSDGWLADVGHSLRNVGSRGPG